MNEDRTSLTQKAKTRDPWLLKVVTLFVIFSFSLGAFALTFFPSILFAVLGFAITVFPTLFVCGFGISIANTGFENVEYQAKSFNKDWFELLSILILSAFGWLICATTFLRIVLWALKYFFQVEFGFFV